MEHAVTFFSIVIPTFNRGDKISSAICSLLEQTYTNFEIIIVDDGSTDNTEEIVRGIKDDRIRYFKKHNEERNIARNYGISKANGKYIGFLDSDDYYYPHHLQEAAAFIEDKNQPEVIHLGYEVKCEDGTVLYQKNNLTAHVNEQLIQENPLSCNAIIIRSDIIRKHMFLHSKEAVIGEDYYLWLILAARYPIHCSKAITSVIVEHSKRSLKNINPDKLIPSVEVIIKQLKEDDAFLKKYSDKVGFFFANCYTLIALTLALTKTRRGDTMRYLLKAIQQDISVIGRRRFLASVKHWI